MTNITPPLPKKKIPPTHSRHILVITRGNRYIYVYIWRYGFYPMINNCALVVFILKFIATSRASGIPKMIYTWSKWISKPQAIFKYEYPLIFLLQYRKLIFCVINNYTVYINLLMNRSSVNFKKNIETIALTMWIASLFTVLDKYKGFKFSNQQCN